MNLEIKKDLASNWFKTLQDAFCDNICKIEKNKTRFKNTSWKRSMKKDEVAVNLEFYKMAKFLRRWGKFSKFMENFRNSFKKYTWRS